MRRFLLSVVAKPKRPPLLPAFEIWEELGRMEDDGAIEIIEQLRSTESTGSDFCFLKACHEAGEEIRDFLGDQPVKIIASGISCFNGQRLAYIQWTYRSKIFWNQNRAARTGIIAIQLPKYVFSMCEISRFPMPMAFPECLLHSKHLEALR